MNRELLSVGPITIYYYSVIMLLAILTAIFISLKRSKEEKKFIEDLIFITIIFGIIGARLYYVIFNFSLYKNDLLFHI